MRTAESMKRRWIRICMTVLLFLSLLAVTVNADCGPKPSIYVSFEDVGECYATLLASETSYGPWCLVPPESGDEVFNAFASYEDADGYCFWGEYWQCSETEALEWRYYPPSPFKVLVYFPESQTCVVSQSQERNAFDAHFTAKLLADGRLEISPVQSIMTDVLSLLGRVLATVLIELGVAWLFRLAERSVIPWIVGVNVLTQLLLHFLLSLVDWKLGGLAAMMVYFLAEFVVVALESVLYCIFLRRHSTKSIGVGRCVLYAVTANAISCFVGLALF